ncbi:polysaccharide deacetylase family protein [Fodinisporobacter ferrooxydans]|uniref:Polysaccharide deacetylase family protein n=1 Tax=Fodinisporobacter ferrooxydans TaxID=2901836 RepID=A0ABY4CES8_9BACL|nr:polysaccharide deacetylase family protein [Alicyclobacillaceae bacterium MYW30-H2]
MINALTVDVEDWYQTSDFHFPIANWHRYEDRVVENTRVLLELFSFYRVKGTFFTLGCIAERHPDLVEKIAADGHEIGSHGGWHQMLHEMSFEQIREDLFQSKKILEQISGKPVHMFRAPSWSMSPQRYQVLQVLEELGYLYDSSMQPFRTPLSGIKGIPIHPFHPVLDGEALHLVEFPPTVLNIGCMNIPFSGGFYLRALPGKFVEWALKRVNEERSGMIYVHPWEIDMDQPRLEASPIIRFVHYYNLETMKNKLERLLQVFTFSPLGEVIRNHHSFPKVPLYSNGNR